MKKVDLEHFPVSENGQKLLSYVTAGWYDKAYVGKWMFEVEGSALDQIQPYFEACKEQMFWLTATWGLKYHEIKYGLPVREDLPYEERRRRIRERALARICPNPHNMEQLIAGIVPENVTVHVADINDNEWLMEALEHPNVFHVVLIGDEQAGTIDMGAIREVLDQVKQSHTVCLFFYRLSLPVHVEIDYSEQLTFQDHFSIHDNILVFDSSWVFDGSEVFRGLHRFAGRCPVSLFDGSWVFDGSEVFRRELCPESILDDYPVRLGLRMESELPISFDDGLKVQYKYWTFNGAHTFDGTQEFSAREWEYSETEF